MSNAEALYPGAAILLREVWNGRIWTARPVRVVSATPELTVLYMMPGTRYKHPRSPDGSPVPCFLPDAWRLVDREWTGEGMLYLCPPGEWYMVMVLWSPGNPHRFDGWYFNFQRPLQRTALGFDYLDMELDMIVRPGRTQWQLKDEDRFADAQSRGRISSQAAAAVRDALGMAKELVGRADSILTQSWESWVPPADWTVPTLPAAWSRL